MKAEEVAEAEARWKKAAPLPVELMSVNVRFEKW